MGLYCLLSFHVNISGIAFIELIQGIYDDKALASSQYIHKSRVAIEINLVLTIVTLLIFAITKD